MQGHEPEAEGGSRAEDPDVVWEGPADALRPGTTIKLIQQCALEEMTE